MQVPSEGELLDRQRADFHQPERKAERGAQQQHLHDARAMPDNPSGSVIGVMCHRRSKEKCA